MIKTRHLFLEHKFFYGSPFFVFLIIFISPFIFFNQFHDPYTTIKWIFILFCVNFLLLLFLYQQHYLFFPKLPKLSIHILLLCLFVSFTNLYLHDIHLFSFETMRRLIFWEFTLFFFNLLSVETKKRFDTIINFIHFTSAIFLCGAFIQYIFYPKNPPYFTFGNIAHSAEYIGFCIALQFGLLARLWKRSKTSLKFDLLSAVSLAYVFLSHSRAASVGVVFIFAAALFLDKKYIKYIIKILIYSAIFLLLISFFISNTNEAEIIFKKDYGQRWLIYTNTLKMIFENPLGVGLGQYEFSSIPYLKNVQEFNEFTIFNTPHNDFLHILAEDGIILSALFFSFGLSLIYFLWNDIKRIFCSHPEFIFFSCMLFSFASFQFPLMNPLPYFMTALMIGYFFALRTKELVTYQLTKKLRLGFISINLIALFVFMSTFSANYISYNFPTNQNLNKISCSIGTRDWLACLNVAASYLEAKEYDKAETYIQQTLNWNPLNYQGIKFLGLTSLYQGNTQKACDLLKKYGSFFREPTSISTVIDNQCQPFL